MDKRDVFNQIIESLRKSIENAQLARDTAQKEANSHIGAMQSRYDTWKEENQYEVAAQELRIRDYQNGIGQIEYLLTSDSLLKPNKTVRLGSIVQLRSDAGEQKMYVISPAGGGAVVKDGEISIFTLTTESPLSKKLIGLEIGDECELNIGGQKNMYELKEVL